MRHAKSGNHSVLHSEKRHRSRRYKRKIRILFVQIIFIIILIFVAIKFVKNDEEKPKVTSLSAEAQKEIINNELQQENQQTDKETSEQKELKTPDISTQGLSILSAKLEYVQKENKTIVSIDVKNYSEKIQDMILKIAFVNKDDEILEETYLKIEYLNENETTRVNLVIDRDISEANRIEIREEK